MRQLQTLFYILFAGAVLAAILVNVGFFIGIGLRLAGVL